MSTITVTATVYGGTPQVNCNCSPWWRGANLVIPAANCKVAYTPIGAPSYANSLINNANPGTYNALETNAPSWDTADGWTFDGSADSLYIDSLTLGDDIWSLFLRVSNVTGRNGAYPVSAGSDWHINPYTLTDTSIFNNLAISDASYVGFSSGVFGFANRKCWYNGERVATIGTATGSAGATFKIAHDGSVYWAGKIQAMAIYDIELTDAQATALYIAMMALPTYSDG